jgi:hypothetical protein
MPQARPAQGVHGIADRYKVLKEFAGKVLVDAIVQGKLQSDLEHEETVEGHPGGAVGLGRMSDANDRMRLG